MYFFVQHGFISCNWNSNLKRKGIMYCSPLLVTLISSSSTSILNNKLTQPQPTLPPTILPKMDLCPAFIIVKYQNSFWRGRKGREGEMVGKLKPKHFPPFKTWLLRKKIPWANETASASLSHPKCSFYFKILQKLPTSTACLFWILLWNNNGIKDL